MSNDDIKYDPIVDIAYIRLSNSRIVDSELALPGVVYDYDENDRVVGVEISSVKKRTPESLKELLVHLNDLVQKWGYKNLDYSKDLVSV